MQPASFLMAKGKGWGEKTPYGSFYKGQGAPFLNVKDS